ncbi:hypothetical protein L6452_19443 [Arctium lappa]|uniref:Uncharacterized protein n=1 Tax=Arctium lappa TaxID=4217 RepID=A0ACB9B8L3_ARCLA|nr:hypothetical protein L6452_19443 [Arctium lappa]
MRTWVSKVREFRPELTAWELPNPGDGLNQEPTSGRSGLADYVGFRIGPNPRSVPGCSSGEARAESGTAYAVPDVGFRVQIETGHPYFTLSGY